MVVVKVALGVGTYALLGYQSQARGIMTLHVVEHRLRIGAVAAFVAAAPDHHAGAVLVAGQGLARA